MISGLSIRWAWPRTTTAGAPTSCFVRRLAWPTTSRRCRRFTHVQRRTEVRPVYKSYMERGVRDQSVELDRFGVYNMQLYHKSLTFYVSDLEVNGKKIDLSPHYSRPPRLNCRSPARFRREAERDYSAARGAVMKQAKPERFNNHVIWMAGQGSRPVSSCTRYLSANEADVSRFEVQ
jgi:hypothetical protein